MMASKRLLLVEDNELRDVFDLWPNGRPALASAFAMPDGETLSVQVQSGNGLPPESPGDTSLTEEWGIHVLGTQLLSSPCDFAKHWQVVQCTGYPRAPLPLLSAPRAFVVRSPFCHISSLDHRARCGGGTRRVPGFQLSGPGLHPRRFRGRFSLPLPLWLAILPGLT